MPDIWGNLPRELKDCRSVGQFSVGQYFDASFPALAQPPTIAILNRTREEGIGRIPLVSIHVTVSHTKSHCKD
jgi:hypothetical protein